METDMRYDKDKFIKDTQNVHDYIVDLSEDFDRSVNQLIREMEKSDVPNYLLALSLLEIANRMLEIVKCTDGTMRNQQFLKNLADWLEIQEQPGGLIEVLELNISESKKLLAKLKKLQIDETGPAKKEATN